MQWLAEICIKRPVFTWMLMAALLVVGVLGFFTLGVDRFPNVDIPTVTVIVNNPGAAPGEIETEITKKLEDQINTVSGIDTLESTSSEGRSQVTVQFVLSKDVNVAAQDVRDKINLIRNDLPETAEEPIIKNSIWLPRRFCKSPFPRPSASANFTIWRIKKSATRSKMFRAWAK